MNSIRDILNKIKWDKKENHNDYTITYIHRGVLDDELTIDYNEIKEIHQGSFTVYSAIFDEEVRIPYHRIKRITNTRKELNIYVKTTISS